jgi:hypothetical protein
MPAPPSLSITPSTASPSPEAPNINVLRNKLLDRLEAERNQVRSPVVGDEVIASGEALRAESRLRTKAQLRVRLAAAKRAHEEPGTEQARREEMLRAKLKGGRRTID